MTGGFCHKGGTKLSLILIIDAVHDNSFLVKARCPSWERELQMRGVRTWRATAKRSNPVREVAAL
jgi:hypothetical protein